MSIPLAIRQPWDCLLSVPGEGGFWDASRFNRTPTVSAGATIVSRVIDFDGSSSAQVSYPDTAELDVSPLTIAFWCRIDSGNAGRISLVAKHVDTAVAANWKGWYFHHATSTYGYLLGTTEDAATKYKVRYYAAATTYNDGTWRHVSWVMPDKNVPANWVFYVNGVAVATTDLSNSGTISTMDTAEPLKLGGKTTSNQDKYLNGALSDLLILDRALSAAEVYEIFILGSGKSRP